MNNQETLRQYLSYVKDEDNITNVFYVLDYQMKLWHKRGYYIPEITSDTIVENNGYFTFPKVIKMKDYSNDVSENIEAMAKLAMGAYVSKDIGFTDYTHFDTSYLKDNFNSIEHILPRQYHIDAYFKRIMSEEKQNEYFSDFIDLNNTVKGDKGQVMVKTSPQAALYNYSSEDAGFVRIVFYPIMAALLFIMMYFFVKIV